MSNISSLFKSLNTDWKDDMISIIDKHAENINKCLDEESKNHIIYPPINLIFSAFNQFNTDNLRVVIIGQDPYINEGEAMGLSFSIPKGIKTPPSLKNILKEIELEYGNECDTDLTHWAKQGVLLLNRSLTVRRKQSNSHRLIWDDLIKDMIKYICDTYEHIVYILWGKDAEMVEKYIDKNNNLVLKAVHPSPLAQLGKNKFLGCNHFKLCNEYLKRNGYDEIKWV
jgi:uracil-DNA glycosylase